MTSIITHVTDRPGESYDVPYLDVRVIWKPFDNMAREYFMFETLEYVETSVIKNLAEYKKALKGEGNWEAIFSNAPRFYIAMEPKWRYIEKFDAFVFCERVSHCPITRTIITELKEFMDRGGPRQKFRHTDDAQLSRMLKALDIFWD